MRRTTSYRALPLFMDERYDATSFATWLAGEPAEVRRVSSLRYDGVVMQRPVVEDGAYVDPSAQLIGGVIVSKGCYIGPYAVIRLDEKPTAAPLVIGEGSNVQDGAVVHSTTQSIGRRVIVAHQAIVHGAVVEDDVTLYIRSVVDGGGTVIGAGAFIHAGAYVGKGIRVPAGRYVAPNRAILTQAEADALPTVPEALLAVRASVLQDNAAHIPRYQLAD